MKNRVKETRGEKNITQFEISKLYNITQAYLSLIENKKIYPYPGWKKRIALALEVEEDYLFTEIYNVENSQKEVK